MTCLKKAWIMKDAWKGFSDIFDSRSIVFLCPFLMDLFYCVDSYYNKELYILSLGVGHILLMKARSTPYSNCDIMLIYSCRVGKKDLLRKKTQ